MPGFDGWLAPIAAREAYDVLGLGPVPALIILESGATVRATWCRGYLEGSDHLIGWWPEDSASRSDVVGALNIRAWRPARQ
jgi:hypothetical protein